MSETALLRTALYTSHLIAGARMVPFAGYEMPVQYTGILAEAKAVRTGKGMFDVSHMARLEFSGPAAGAALDAILTNELSKLAPGKGQYTLITNDQGGCVDDAILYQTGPEAFMLVVNASNHAKDVAWIQAHLPSEGVEMRDVTEVTYMIAVQGPEAVAAVAALSADGEALTGLAAFGFLETQVAGTPSFVARSGYTGEDGFELIGRASDAETLWEALLKAGVVPCGLGSRDTLRLEAGLPLYGHELEEHLNPISAGLGWAISKTKTFPGSAAIAAARESGTPQTLRGVQLSAKRLLAPGMAIYLGNRKVGELVSGVISATLETGIGSAFVDANVPVDAVVDVELRGKREPARLVNKRFYKRGS